MIKREILASILENLENPKIILITGPRQAGKTTLMKIVSEKLAKEGKSFVFLNLDVEDDFVKLRTQREFLNYLKLELGTKERSYVFIDEIQRKEDAGRFLKGLYDLNLPYKFIISGSGSIELKEKVSEGLAGRRISFHLSTVTFREFVNYKTKYKYENNLYEYLASELYDNDLFVQYCRFGGYPEVITHETLEQKQLILQSIYDSFIDKDIKDLLEVRNTFGIRDLLTLLSTQIGRILPTSSIANTVNLSFETTQKYLYYLEKVFIIKKVRPYYTNPRLELTKAPVYYFSDLGMRNYVMNRLSFFDPIGQGPMLFQNFVYLLLRNQEDVSEIRYWRTKGKAEVDFIVSIGAEILPVEIKFKKLKRPTLSKSVISFIEKYRPANFIVVNLKFRVRRDFNGTHIWFVPYTDLVERTFIRRFMGS